MPQNQSAIQIQTEQMLQRLTPQQLLNVQLVAMSIADLEQRVKDEMDINEAFEEGDEARSDTYADEYDNTDADSVDEETSASIEVGDYAPDDIPTYIQNRIDDGANEQRPLGESVSFIDDLMSQMMDYDLDEHQIELVTYLIGSLNSRGFIEQPLYYIADEMLFHHNIETDEQELAEALRILQQFEPAGIGARNYQECLLIQLDRKLSEANLSASKEESLRLQRRIISDEFDAFTNRNIERLSDHLGMEKSMIQYAIGEIRKLNLNPGLSLSESSSDRVQVAIPDFIVETDGEGGISFRLNNDSLPTFHVSEEYRELAARYQMYGSQMKERDRAQLAYCKEKYDKAQMFIEAVNQRHRTLMVTMDAIISLQRQFFLTQDPADMVALIYKDVAERTKFDISTISRVCQSKYASVDGHIYPLSAFFKHNRKNSRGEEVESDAVAQAIIELIENEDKDNPLSDDQIALELKNSNINIARRTVSSYRSRLAIPPAVKRKR